MEKNTKKEAIKKIISEEIARFEKIKTLQAKKKQLSEALNLLEEGKLDEISWQGIKNAVGFGGNKAAEVGAAAGNAVANKASAINQGINKKVQNVGKKIGHAAASVGDSASQFKQGLSAEMTKGDIATIKIDLSKRFDQLVSLVKDLNKKQVKLGIKPTTLKSFLFKYGNQAVKKPAIAESKIKKN